MTKPSKREAETQELNREVPFTSSPKDEINEGTSISIKVQTPCSA
jgi:hypothetical protein